MPVYHCKSNLNRQQDDFEELFLDRYASLGHSAGDKELTGTLRGFDVFVNMVLEEVEAYETTSDGVKVTKLEQILLNGNNIAVIVPGGKPEWLPTKVWSYRWHLDSALCLRKKWLYDQLHRLLSGLDQNIICLQIPVYNIRWESVDNQLGNVRRRILFVTWIPVQQLLHVKYDKLMYICTDASNEVYKD